MREADGRRMHTRCKGRAALERSLRVLVIRVSRFGDCRARTPEDVAWTARTLDVLAAALEDRKDGAR